MVTLLDYIPNLLASGVPPADYIDAVSRYGVIPLLIWLVFQQRTRIKDLESSLQDLNDQHKVDIRSASEDNKSLLQSVLGALARMEGSIRSLEKK